MNRQQRKTLNSVCYILFITSLPIMLISMAIYRLGYKESLLGALIALFLFTTGVAGITRMEI